MEGAPGKEYEGMNKISIPVISALKATKLLMHGCQGFLATIIDKKGVETKIENIAVIREYPDVFSEDLPSLPPDRKVEFSIDLLLGISPISKAPYRMSPAEMKELKNQL